MMCCWAEASPRQTTVTSTTTSRQLPENTQYLHPQRHAYLKDRPKIHDDNLGWQGIVQHAKRRDASLSVLPHALSPIISSLLLLLLLLPPYQP